MTSTVRTLSAIALLLSLTACIREGEFGPLPSDLAPLFGRGAAPARAPAPHVPATGASKMLQDAESLEDWSDEVAVPFNRDSAVMQAEALRRCQQLLGGDPLSQVVAVEQRTRTPNQSGNVKWICKFRTEKREVPGAYDNQN
ncbi:hypothetical protein [Stenomitos frigidus]|uniref:Lipoprotein n=1 Tax=Stenomitos frigidus ULC18 TaxID=2107698 RepID=A0A2T1EAY6_9CYAN|nr:hypothetical protein [Stenomitos frigidus]PSB29919.1 hypothetical protein C7B82_10220 [Stenomitos frigidus ULC18]